MAQFVDFACLPDRDGAWHLGTVRRLLREVATGPTQRKLTAWLRQVRIYDRAFIGQLVRLVDLKVGAKVTLGPFGLELLDALAESEKLDKAAAAAEPDSRPRAARGVARDESTEDDLPTGPVTIEDMAKAAKRPRAEEGDEGEEGAPKKKAAAEPETAVKDPFKEALFDRFVELNGYLARFIFCEVADGFLAPTEMVKRLGSSIYRGIRPQLLPFQSWLKWMEWLGYVRGVGFRQKLTVRGIEAWKYLKEIPEEELLEGGASPLEAFALEAASSLATPAPAPVAAPPAQAPPAPAAPAAAPPAAAAKPRAAAGARAAEDDEEAGEDAPPPSSAEAPAATAPRGRRDVELEDEEGLDLPPEVELPEGEGGAAGEEVGGPVGEEGEEEGDAGEILAALRGDEPVATEDAAAGAGSNGGALAAEPGDGDGAGGAAVLEAEEAAEEAEDAEDAGAGAGPATPAVSRAAAGSGGEEDSGAEAADEDDRRGARPVPRPAAPAPAPTPAAAAAASDFSARMRALAAEAAAIPERTRGREAAPPAAAPAGRGAAAPRAPAPPPPPAPAPAAASAPSAASPVAPAPVAPSAPTAAGSPGDAIAAFWEAAPERRPCAASDFGFKAEHYLAGGDAKPLFLFKLAALALLLEAPGTFAPKATLFRELARAKAFEGLFLHDWPLEQALEKLGLLRPDRDWTAVEERLAHLARIRRGLKDGGDGLAARLEAAAPAERSAALRGEALGNSLGAGVYWLEREMRRLGLWA